MNEWKPRQRTNLHKQNVQYTSFEAKRRLHFQINTFQVTNKHFLVDLLNGSFNVKKIYGLRD